jgi:endoglucanase
MPQHLSRRLLWSLPALGVLVAATLVLALASATGDAAPVPLSIAVQGNHFVNGAGQTVHLLGVDHASFEYACEEGYAYNDGNMTPADASAIASWKATAVRVPLNEDCWLGINGMPSNSQNPSPPLTMAGYRQAVEDYVSDLTNAGLYVILDLHWTAPGTFVADGQRAMPDDHSAAFWTSVASTFSSNPAIVFDAFNEPYSPAMVNDPARPVSWDCWKSGGCAVPDANDSAQTPNDAQIYDAVGMQAMVDAIRATGAHQPILLGGLSYANDLSGWLSHEPTDPLGQLAASFHNYQGETCSTQACWDAQVAPVAAQVPVVTGEFDQDVCSPSTFDTDYMTWADAHGIGYLAWGWWVLTPQEISDDGCSAYYLITDPAGTPAAPNGVNLHDHLAALPAAVSAPAPTPTTPTPTTPTPTVGSTAKAPKLASLAAKIASNGKSADVTVKSNEAGTGHISASTVSLFAVGPRHHRQHVTLGSASFKVLAGTSKTVAFRLSTTSHSLLTRLHHLKVHVTITLTNASHQKTVALRTLTLALPG